MIPPAWLSSKWFYILRWSLFLAGVAGWLMLAFGGSHFVQALGWAGIMLGSLLNLVLQYHRPKPPQPQSKDETVDGVLPAATNKGGAQ
jgi:hypothetical protein